MAGDWIKVENTTPSKPEIDAIAEQLKVPVNEVIGGLVRLWIWADQQTIDGNAVSVTKTAIDRHSGVTGLADAMLLDHIHWLEINASGGFSFPNFNRHNGQTAKQRALTAKRVQAKRKRSCNDASVTQALPEKRREENIRTPIVPFGDECAKKKSEIKSRNKSGKFKRPNLLDVTAYCLERKNGINPQEFLDHYDACGWRYGTGTGKPIQDWQAAVRTWEARRKNQTPNVEPYDA